MRYLLFILYLFVATSVYAQGDMRVYTVAGGAPIGAPLGDGGPATAASLDATEGVWLDSSGNIYICDMAHARIRKVSATTGIITTITGVGITGYSGDNGPATAATIKKPYGLYIDNAENIYFADMGNNRIRKIDGATNIISTIAGGGTSLGDGGPATNAQLYTPQNVYGDKFGNLYIGEIGRIRKINSIGIISTIAGSGITGLSGDGGPAINAQVSNGPSGMVFDKDDNLFFSDRGNSRIRKIYASSGFIETIAGTDYGYSGDNSLAVNAQIAGPIGLAMDSVGNLLIVDNNNDVIRKVDIATGIITTIAGGGTSTAEGALATETLMHPEFIYLDNYGNIFYSNWGAQIRKITNYKSGSPNTSVSINFHKNISIHPNPTTDLLTIELQTTTNYTLLSIVGTTLQHGQLHAGSNTLSLSGVPAGIYLLALTGVGGERSVTRIIKQ